MFGEVLSFLLIAFFLWAGITSAIAAGRSGERRLLLFAASMLLLCVSQGIPLVDLLIGGFGEQLRVWFALQFVAFVAALISLGMFMIVLGGFTRLRERGITFKDILLLRAA